jgi:cytoskeleton protein RodZ
VGSFGERLQRERAARGISLEEISEATKISARHLRALEGEHFSNLPGGVFNRGFVRSYARFLNLNEEQLVAEYVAADGTHDDLPLPNARLVGTEKERPPINVRAIVQLLIVLVLLAGGIGAWKEYAAEIKSELQQMKERRTRRHTPTSHAPRPKAAETATVETVPASTTPAASTSQNVSVETVPAPSLVVSPDTNVSADSIRDGAGPVSTTASQPAATATRKDALADGFEVVVHANQKSWIAATADGHTLEDGLLDVATQKSYRARKQLVLVAGNAGGLEISYNGHNLGLAGAPNKRKVLTFTSEGLQ